MDRKTAIYPLLDGNTYTFSERNREDVNFTALQNKYRASRINQIKQVHNAKEESEFAQYLIIQEWGRVYYEQEVWKFVLDDPDERKKLVYASFKVANPDITYENFEKLVDAKLVDKLIKAIAELEQDDPALDDEVVKELKVNRQWFVKLKDLHPEVYWAIKSSLKKKVEQK